MKCNNCGFEQENGEFEACPSCGQTNNPEQQPALPEAWEEWKLEGLLGRGSYGAVYKAVRKDHNIESRSAVKIISVPSDSAELRLLHTDGLDSDGIRAYCQGIVDDFVGEIKIMQSFKGIQNIVTIEDYKVVENTSDIGWKIYIRMELLTPFDRYICDKQLTEEEIIKLGCDICTALEICGKRNIIHRDIKPDNIFCNEFGDYKLGDFGIAKNLESFTGGMSQKGTFNYMAPEVASGNSYGASVDIYSLGIVLYRLLNENKLPFIESKKQLLSPSDRKTALERRLQGEAMLPPCNASPELAKVILRACEFNPRNRFASATEMKQALIDVRNGNYKPQSSEILNATVAVSAMPTEKYPENQPKKQTKKTTGIIAAIIAAALIIAGSIIALAVIKKPNDNEENNPPATEAQTEVGATEATADSSLGSVYYIENDDYYAQKTTYNVGDTVLFGNYEQNNRSADGKEVIEWTVLEKQGNSYLLLSKYALDCQSYNTTAEEISWVNCSLRNWLNSDFYDTAFSSSEKSRILSYDTNTYSDRVFCLSGYEAEQYFSGDSARKTNATEYAISRGSYVSGGACGWWLRSRGEEADVAARVNINGEILTCDSNSEGGVERTDYSVRPAVWVSFDN